MWLTRHKAKTIFGNEEEEAKAELSEITQRPNVYQERLRQRSNEQQKWKNVHSDERGLKRYDAPKLALLIFPAVSVYSAMLHSLAKVSNPRKGKQSRIFAHVTYFKITMF